MTKTFRIPAIPVLLSLALWTIIAAIALTQIILSSTHMFSPDSWALADISRSFFTSNRVIGDIFGTRDYQNIAGVNDSFPLLWPSLIATWTLITRSDFGSIMALNACIWIVTGIVASRISTKLSLNGLVGPLTILLLFVFPWYVIELQAGRNIPLQILILNLAFLAIIRFSTTNKSIDAFLSGMFCGLLGANRFDSQVFSIILLASFLVWVKPKVFNALLISLGYSLSLAPGILYSKLRLNSFLASDNSHVPFSSTRATPLNVIAENQTQFNLFEWSARIGGNFAPTLTSFNEAFGSLALFCISFAFFFIAHLTISNKRGVAEKAGTDRLSSLWIMRIWLISLVLLAVTALQMMLTGYTDVRYWLPSTSLALLAISLKSVSVYREHEKFDNFATFYLFAFLALLVLVLGNFGQYLPRHINQESWDRKIGSCLSVTDGTVVFSVENNATLAARLAATTDIRTAFAPNDRYSYDRETWAWLSNEYNLKYWYTQDENEIPDNAKGFIKSIYCFE
jgi:hypothetical protein